MTPIAGPGKPVMTEANTACPGWDSNPHWTVFETASSAGWDTGAAASMLPLRRDLGVIEPGENR